MNKALEVYLPKIKDDIAVRLKAAGKNSNVSDDEFSEMLSEIYKSLPRAIRFVIKKDRFISLCFEYRDRLF